MLRYRQVLIATSRNLHPLVQTFYRIDETLTIIIIHYETVLEPCSSYNHIISCERELGTSVLKLRSC